MTFDSDAPHAAARGCLTRARGHLERVAPALAALAVEVAWESPAAGEYRAQVDTQRRVAEGLILDCDAAGDGLRALELRPVATGEGGG
ncbi:hypothetical protein [Microbacterium stercoris]|uniref:Uncharacterized protein n=1 Tax=Microbacterium stercoris TaxID=2820289 RepID=A0A939QJD2_9MICO|nr:hypothetical protein [Microbacterium stercoris]MBO3662757.1 hypothetical protein [Microbacterium stercoris]